MGCQVADADKSRAALLAGSDDTADRPPGCCWASFNCRAPSPVPPALPRRPVSAALWVNEDGESLPDCVAEAMSKYLKARVQL